jgi:hypothetical protein
MKLMRFPQELFAFVWTNSETQNLYEENYVNFLHVYFEGWYLNFNIV